MILSELLTHLESIAPPELAMDWDNVGLMLGDPSWEITKALVSLDVSPSAVEAALAENCNLILSHHPLIFRPLKQITDPLLIKLLTHKIAVVSLHTNLDVADQGVNHALAAKLGMDIHEVLDEDTGLGLVCILPASLSLQSLAQHVKRELHCDHLKLWTAGFPREHQVQRIAICGGSGASLIGAASARAEVLITGDVSYHSYLESPIPIIDAGHFHTEFPVLQRLGDFLGHLHLEYHILPADQHEYPQYMHCLA